MTLIHLQTWSSLRMLRNRNRWLYYKSCFGEQLSWDQTKYVVLRLVGNLHP